MTRIIDNYYYYYYQLFHWTDRILNKILIEILNNSILSKSNTCESCFYRLRSLFQLQNNDKWFVIII